MRHLLSLVLLSVLLAAPGSGRAAFVDNGNYTTDTATGLDWLDLTSTQGLTYAYVVTELGAGGAFAGWRYANDSDIDVLLFSSLGFPATSLNSSVTGASILPNAQNAVALFGATASGFAGGQFESQYASAMRVGTAEFYFDQSAGTLRWEAGPFSLGQNKWESRPHFGSFLVRVTGATPIPLPAAGWLMLSGLAGLMAVRRPRQR